jgi:lipopolysaccharide biosynthesis glycosyltransferase
MSDKRDRCAVFIFYNTEYLNGAMVTLHTFFNAYSSVDHVFDLYYLSNHLCQLDESLNRNLINSLRYRNVGRISALHVDQSRLDFYQQEMERYKGSGVNLSIFTYEAFSSQFQDYRRLFYMDADLLFIRPNLEWLEEDFQLSICPDLGIKKWLKKPKIGRVYQKEEILLNAGLIVVNPRRLDLSDFYTRLIDYHRENMTSNYPLFEQGLLGRFLKGTAYDVLFSSYKNNMLRRLLISDHFQANSQQASMVHYVGFKPFSTRDFRYSQMEYLDCHRFYWIQYSQVSRQLLMSVVSGRAIKFNSIDGDTPNADDSCVVLTTEALSISDSFLVTLLLNGGTTLRFVLSRMDPIDIEFRTILDQHKPCHYLTMIEASLEEWVENLTSGKDSLFGTVGPSSDS